MTRWRKPNRIVTVKAAVIARRAVGGATRRRPPSTPATVEITTMIAAPTGVDRPKVTKSIRTCVTLRKIGRMRSTPIRSARTTASPNTAPAEAAAIAAAATAASPVTSLVVRHPRPVARRRRPRRRRPAGSSISPANETSSPIMNTSVKPPIRPTSARKIVTMPARAPVRTWRRTALRPSPPRRCRAALPAGRRGRGPGRGTRTRLAARRRSGSRTP